MSRKKRILSTVLILTLTLSISGCYGRRIYDIETRLEADERALDAIQDSLVIILEQTTRLDSLIGGSSIPLRTNRALIESRLDELQTRLEILEALVKENRYRISQMWLLRGQPGEPAGEEAMPDTVTLQSSLAQHIYQTAYVDYAKGNFQSAITGFREFVERYPETELSDDAQFLIARSYFMLGDYKRAITEFRRVLDNYPMADRVPAAMYNLGLCYLEIEDVETAREYFKLVVTRYPQAPESREAKTALDSLPPPPEEEVR